MTVRMSSLQFMYNYKNSLNGLYQQQAKLFEQADGSTIHRGSDDPVGYSKLLRYNTSANENEQYKQDVNTGLSWMRTSDNAMSHIADIMKTFSEKTIEAATDLDTDPDHQAIAKEMMSHIQEIVSLGNTQQGDRYVFSGQKDTTQPFILSNDEYDRGLAKTLDDAQAAFFKNTSGDVNARLYQMLTLNYTDPDTGEEGTYYFDTESGYVYPKKFIDEGYKEVIAMGYTSIDEIIEGKVPDTAVSEVSIAKCAIGKVEAMTVEQAQELVDAASENDLMQAIQADDINDTDVPSQELRTALKILYTHKLSELENNVTTASETIMGELADVTPIMYDGDGDEITRIVWSAFDTDTHTLETAAIHSWGTTWNGSPSSGKQEFINDMLKAVDDYAKGEYDVLDLDGADTDATVYAADDAAKTVLETVYATNPDIDNATMTAGVVDSNIDILARAEVVRLAAIACAPYEPEEFKVADAFTNQGLLRENVEEDDRVETVNYKLNSTGKYSVESINVALFKTNSDGETYSEDAIFGFTTLKQKIVTYSGDEKYISMVKMNGATDPRSDTVNLTGQDLFGSDIFDNELSGNTQSGSAMINNMLTVYTKTNAPDPHWLISDGVTLSDVSHSTITIAETTLGSRMQLYDSVSTMLERHGDDITEDITNVSGTDVAYLATKLMEMTTLYNMSLALGGRILPQSLADYL